MSNFSIIILNVLNVSLNLFNVSLNVLCILPCLMSTISPISRNLTSKLLQIVKHANDHLSCSCTT